MHEIECILHEYLSFNWDRVEDIYDANSVYLSEDGLRCLWRSNHHLSVGAGLLLSHENCLQATARVRARQDYCRHVHPGLSTLEFTLSVMKLCYTCDHDSTMNNGQQQADGIQLAVIILK